LGVEKYWTTGFKANFKKGKNKGRKEYVRSIILMYCYAKKRDFLLV